MKRLIISFVLLTVWTAAWGQLRWTSADRRYTDDVQDVPDLGTELTLKGWRGETVMAQASFRSEKEFRLKDLPSGIEVGRLGYVMADELNPDGSGCGRRPDHRLFDSLLVADWIKVPLDGRFEGREAGKTGFLWVEYAIPADAAPGIHSFDLDFYIGRKKWQTLTLKVDVSDRVLPPASDWKFHLDLWQNPYTFVRVDNVPLWSDAHFRARRPLMERLARAGQKVITATLCDRPWDGQTEDPFASMVSWTRRRDGSWAFGFEDFDRWVSFMMSCGVTEQINCYSMIPWALKFKYFDEATGRDAWVEGGPGTPLYDEVWVALLKAFSVHLREKGWFDKVCIGIDERPMESVLSAVKVVRAADPAFRFAFAGHYHEELEPLIYDYCAGYNTLVPEDVVARRREEGLITTYYTCCSQGYPNTFTFSPPCEAALLPLQMVDRNVDGYLRWAYNSWTADPFNDSRFRTWASGDCYLVYPGNVSSVRFEKLFEGIQQAEKLRILREEGRPVIGISCGRGSSGGVTLSANYTSAVERAGGIPMVFPTISDTSLAADLVGVVDGVIFSGGPDLDPSHYGETFWNETVEVDTLRDASDLLLMRAALDSGKPVMGICRGEQLLNVVLGGSLVQDLPTQVGETVTHGGGAMHRIGVDKESVLYGLFGADSLTVNSFHHQAVRRVAPRVRVTARAEDGTVEAYEYGDQVVAFQFHPEGMARTDATWLAPFRYFVRRILLGK